MEAKKKLSFEEEHVEKQEENNNNEEVVEEEEVDDDDDDDDDESDEESVQETDSEGSLYSYDSEEEDEDDEDEEEDEDFMEGEDDLLDCDHTEEDSRELSSSARKRAKPESLPSAKKPKTTQSLTPKSSGSRSCSTPRSGSKKRKRSASKGSPSRRSSSTKTWPVQASSFGKEDRWHDILKEDKHPRLPSFQPQRPPGPQLQSSTAYTPLELFQLFMSMSVVGQIVENTNDYAEKRAQSGKQFTWFPLTVAEFYTYMSLVIYMGLTRLKEFRDYWSEKSIYSLPFPRSVMSRNRFLAITGNLYLCNLKKDEENTRKKGTPEYDRLFKIKPLYTDLLSACQTYFQPSRELSIDERMVASKARMGLKQPTKWGYKLFVLLDSVTGYTWNFFAYESKSELKTSKGLGYDSVTKLVNHPLLGKGYKLYMDNFYTSPKLLSDLYAEKTLACGTIPVNRQGFPRTRRNDMPRNAARGTIRWIRRGGLLFVKWMDTREVALCTTMHKAYDGDKVIKRVKDAKGDWQMNKIPIPVSVKDYNKNMGGADLSNSLVGYYNVHETLKWYKTFFYHFVDLAVTNSFVMHKELAKANGQDALTHKQFRETLATDLSKMSTCLASPMQRSGGDVCYPDFFSVESRAGRNEWCELCSRAGIKVKTSAFCMKCEVPLCLTAKRNCFLQWHQEGLHLGTQ